MELTRGCRVSHRNKDWFCSWHYQHGDILLHLASIAHERRQDLVIWCAAWSDSDLFYERRNGGTTCQDLVNSWFLLFGHDALKRREVNETEIQAAIKSLQQMIESTQ